jgi:hypothetical protein
MNDRGCIKFQLSLLESWTYQVGRIEGTGVLGFFVKNHYRLLFSGVTCDTLFIRINNEGVEAG